MDAEDLRRWFGDAAAHRRADPVWDLVASTTAERLAPGEGDAVLDACCGTGTLTLELARRVGPRGRVTGTDLSAALVARLADRAAREGLHHLGTRVADVRDVPEPGAYDQVTCALGVFFLPDPVRDGRRLVEHLRPGGRLTVTTWAQGGMAPLLPALAQAVAARVPTALDGPDPSARMRTPEDLAGYLADLGLQDVATERVDLSTRLTAAVAGGLLDGTAARMLTEALPDDATRTAVRREVLDAVVGGVLDCSVVVGSGARPLSGDDARR